MDKKNKRETRVENLTSILKSILSTFIWGSGQALNRQFVKALFFFVFFIAFVGIELGTGNYFTEVDPYDKIMGKDYSEDIAETFHRTYRFKVEEGTIKPIEAYETYYEEATKDGQFSNKELYTYIVQEMVEAGPVKDKNNKDKYTLTPLAAEFQEYLTNIYNKPGNQYNAEDFTRFSVRLYMIANEDFRLDFEKRFNNFFYDKAGFFIRGFWGLLTLGETHSLDINQHQEFEVLTPTGSRQFPSIKVQGHYSDRLLLQGLISTLIFLYFCIVWVWNIRDAYKTSERIRREGKVPNEKEYFKEVYHNSFEYIVLFPAIFVVTMISIMPILFGFLVAFTSYNKSNLQLFDWVGFKNFANLFKFGSSDIPWGKMFPRVFTWTLVWAIFSTFTCYFAGFIQALILNNKHVTGRKFWRSILILPWAVPAIISQMILKIMFNDKGIVNSFLNWIGVYDILFDLGMLGQRASDVSSGFWQKLMYLGTDDIQWFTNTINFTFVRAVIIIINIWLGFPFFMALITGVMTSIDRSLYEAADIDGATNFSKFRYITFPTIISQTAPLLLMTFSGNFNNFGMIYFVTEGGVGTADANRAFAGSTDILISWMYRLTVDFEQYGMASVFSILIFLIIGTMSAWNFTRMKAFKED